MPRRSHAADGPGNARRIPRGMVEVSASASKIVDGKVQQMVSKVGRIERAVQPVEEASRKTD